MGKPPLNEVRAAGENRFDVVRFGNVQGYLIVSSDQRHFEGPIRTDSVANSEGALPEHHAETPAPEIWKRPGAIQYNTSPHWGEYHGRQFDSFQVRTGDDDLLTVLLN